MRYSIDTECVFPSSLAILELNASYFCKTYPFAYPNTSSDRETNFDD